MKKNLKTIEAVNAYNTVKDAKLTKMEEGEQFSLILIMRSLKKAASDYGDFVKDAQEKLKPENFSDLQERAGRFPSLSDEEKIQTNRELQAYNEKVEKCVRPESEKQVEIDIEPLSREGFGRFMKSNDFTAETALTLYDILCE